MTFALATEDKLSEAIGLKLLQAYAPRLSDGVLPLRKDGFGYLRSGMDKWIQLSKQRPVLLLTDLDKVECAKKMKEDWLNGRKQPAGLLFRIVVRTIESWLLADDVAMKSLFGKNIALPAICDDIAEPKQYLLQLARKAKRDVREDLLVMRGTVASQGIAYNDRLCELVQSTWCPERAAQRSPSLERAIASLQRFVQQA